MILTTRSQIVAVDLGANMSNVVTSPVVLHSFVAPTGPSVGGRIYASGSLGATGTASQSSWLVTQFN